MRTDDSGKQWNSTLRRRTPLRAKPDTEKARKPAFKKGPKTKQWDSDRAKLKVVFERAGITRCELQISSDCKRDDFLGFCHSKKRRFVLTQADREEVCLGCVVCHDAIEILPTMQAIVLRVIRDRETPVESIFDKIEDS